VDARIDLLGLPRPKLAVAVAGLIDRPFRVDQLFGAIHRRGVSAFAEMTDLGGSLRLALAGRFRIDGLPIATRSDSTDGTRKFLFRLPEGSTVETVDIPDRGRHTLCLSSQAGCALACRFCVTGYWGAGRSLTAGEIVAQVRALRWGDPPLPPQMNLVFMGMGEPLLNLGALRDAIDVLSDDISPRRITISTAGIVPGIVELAGWPRRPNLAVSLHAPDDARRTELMPVNASYPLAELLAALRGYPLERGRRITFEYILIRNYNDSLRDADALARLLRGLPSKINLIPANSDPVLDARMAPSEEGAVERFQRRLMDRGYTTTVRRRRGGDVSAACGQLRATGREPRGFRGELSW
jgi:23S rRNA (adenine2503-C2)-methyltransferase